MRTRSICKASEHWHAISVLEFASGLLFVSLQYCSIFHGIANARETPTRCDASLAISQSRDACAFTHALRVVRIILAALHPFYHINTERYEFARSFPFSRKKKKKKNLPGFPCKEYKLQSVCLD